MKFEKRLGRNPSAARSPRASAAAIGAAMLCASLGAGCTIGTPFEEMSAPVAKLNDQPVDEIITGSITPAAEAPLDRLLAPGDHAAVLTALGAALDPQGPGLGVTWTAAGGQGRGEARPLGAARTEGDEICRPFALAGAGLAGKFATRGVGCRNKRGDWRVKTLERVEG